MYFLCAIELLSQGLRKKQPKDVLRERYDGTQNTLLPGKKTGDEHDALKPIGT